MVITFRAQKLCFILIPNSNKLQFYFLEKSWKPWTTLIMTSKSYRESSIRESKNQKSNSTKITFRTFGNFLGLIFLKLESFFRSFNKAVASKVQWFLRLKYKWIKFANCTFKMTLYCTILGLYNLNRLLIFNFEFKYQS